MPRFFGKKGSRGGSRVGVKPIMRKKSYPRRRLQPGLVASVGAGLVAGGIKKLWDKRTKDYKRAAIGAKRRFENRRNETDGISTVAPIVIGTPKVVSFQEKVARTIRPPFMWKRNYQWSAECDSGRKGMFSCEVNVMNNNDLQQDITSYKSAIGTNTSAPDPTLPGTAFSDGAKFYVDKLTETLKMVNSSSNSITGKVHLIAYKRDVDGIYAGVATLNPVSLAMYFSSQGGISLQVNGAGGENTAGNGWFFLASGANSGRYDVTHNMPGSSINSAGLAALVDPTFSLFAPHIKDRMGFFFRNVKTTTFSLKPGEQLNSSYIFNDLPTIHRELQEYVHLKGISYSIVVEFQGGIVGDATALTSTISTGTCQLSCVRESVRILGLKNMLKPNVFLQTAAMTQIATANQVIINADTGVQLSGAIIDP